MRITVMEVTLGISNGFCWSGLWRHQAISQKKKNLVSTEKKTEKQ